MLFKIKTAEAKHGEDVIELSQYPTGIGANHKFCGYTLHVRNTGSYNVLFCAACGLRIKYPTNITKIEDLKKFLEHGVEYEGATGESNRFDLLDMEE